LQRQLSIIMLLGWRVAAH